MEFRKATILDIAEITKMWVALMTETPTYLTNAGKVEQERFFIDVFLKIKRDNIVFVIEKEKELIGFIMSFDLTRTYGSSHTIGFIEQLYVKPEYRSLELMNNFNNFALEEAKRKGIKELQFYIPYEFEFYRKLREKQGYKPIAVLFSKEVI